MKDLHKVAYLLLWIGGLNWALVGLFGFNLVTVVLGTWPILEKVVYLLVGVSAVYTIATHKDYCQCCQAKKK